MASNFTEKEKDMMALAWQCFDDEPKVNYSRLAGLVGMSNERSAANAWARIKKKLAAQAASVIGDDNDEVPTPKPKATTGRKRTRKAASAEDSGNDGEAPVKKLRAKRGNGAAKAVAAEDDVDTAKDVKAEQLDDDDDEDDDGNGFV